METLKSFMFLILGTLILLGCSSNNPTILPPSLLTEFDRGVNLKIYEHAQAHNSEDVVFCIPFNLTIPTSEEVEIKILNITGYKVKTLVNTNFPQGSIDIEWCGKNDDGEFVKDGFYIIDVWVSKQLMARNIFSYGEI